MKKGCKSDFHLAGQHEQGKRVLLFCPRLIENRSELTESNYHG